MHVILDMTQTILTYDNACNTLYNTILHLKINVTYIRHNF